VHALRNTERGILCENEREQRPERDWGTDTILFLFGHAVSLETSRATCFHFARVGRFSVLSIVLVALFITIILVAFSLPPPTHTHTHKSTTVHEQLICFLTFVSKCI